MKQLTFDEIRAATLGAARVCREAGGVRFYRFTEEEERVYRDRPLAPHLTGVYRKTFSTAGIKLSFRTDSRRLFLAISAEQGGSSRSFFSLDVLVDGAPVGYIDNFSDAPPTPDLWKRVCPLGDFERTFDLGEGKKTVTVHLPWSAVLTLREICLDDGATLAPVKPHKRLLVYGDSITHGYDATRPHLRHIAQLCDRLGLEEYNKAIGSEVFFPPLARCACELAPDYVLVAYGTNDWANIDYPTFAKNCADFYTALAARHPKARIFALTPIARGDLQEGGTFGPLARVGEKIREVAAGAKNITVIDCTNAVPREVAFFSDDFLHPNDEGFSHYFENLTREMRKYIK